MLTELPNRQFKRLPSICLTEKDDPRVQPSNLASGSKVTDLSRWQLKEKTPVFISTVWLITQVWIEPAPKVENVPALQGILVKAGRGTKAKTSKLKEVVTEVKSLTTII